MPYEPLQTNSLIDVETLDLFIVMTPARTTEQEAEDTEEADLDVRAFSEQERPSLLGPSFAVRETKAMIPFSAREKVQRRGTGGSSNSAPPGSWASPQVRHGD